MEDAFEKFGSYIREDPQESYFYLGRIINKYLSISPICTPIIDNILADKCPNLGVIDCFLGYKEQELKKYLLRDERTLSFSYYYSNLTELGAKKRILLNQRYITLIKKRSCLPTKNEEEQHIYYVLVYSMFTTNIVLQFLEELFSINQKQMRVTMIEQGIQGGYNNIWETINYLSCSSQSQLNVVEEIHEHWTNSSYKNTKVIISGPSGVGKRYVGALLKSKIEDKEQSFVKLFYNVDLSTPGLNIQHILNMATRKSPVIMIVPNIDRNYAQVYQDEDSSRYLGGTAPTDSKLSFNNTLDAVESAENVIAIYTTTKTKKELDAVKVNSGYGFSSQDYRSFYREGRVDLFKTLKEGTKIDQNYH